MENTSIETRIGEAPDDGHWVREFYARQADWNDPLGPVGEWHRERITTVERLAGRGPWRILELGAGAGQTAAAAAEAGHHCTAIELVPELAAHARALAAASPAGRMSVVEGDFYTAEVGGPFDIVMYWDGFGVSADAGQRRLLKRIAGWLAPEGRAIVEVYTPWYWAAAAGREQAFGPVRRRYGFDADGSRMLDTWWPAADPARAVTQSLRCYAPSDLRLLLEGTGLTLATTEPGGAWDEAHGWRDHVPLAEAQSFLAVLALVGGAALG